MHRCSKQAVAQVDQIDGITRIQALGLFYPDQGLFVSGDIVHRFLVFGGRENDFMNPDLMNTYRVVANAPHELITILSRLQDKYHSLITNEEAKKEFYYEKRALFNERRVDEVTQAALMIMLNKTSFNGLYRVNSSNGFNVPIGSYKKPIICDQKGLMRCSELLQKVIILEGDYRGTIQYASPDSLFYMDPPYRPLNATSNFNSYSKDAFNDESQVELRDFCEKLTVEKKCLWILSNSDMKNVDPLDNFFDDLYQEYYIDRVSASRSINSKASSRGAITELMINNYGFTNDIALPVQLTLNPRNVCTQGA